MMRRITSDSSGSPINPAPGDDERWGQGIIDGWANVRLIGGHDLR